MAAQKPNAFVTLVSSDFYLPGALTLASALKDVHPSPAESPEVPFQTVCLVTPETLDVSTIKRLRKSFDIVIGVEVIGQKDQKGLQLLGRPDLDTVLTKLHIFRLTQFRKIIFLDADVLPIRPLSHLFSVQHEFSAAPDVGWPDIFNSGVLVISPGEEKFEELNTLLQSRGTWDGGDQGLLNEWRGNDWNRLSFTYNTTPTAAYTYAPAYERFGSKISAIHFIGPNKPWTHISYRTPGVSTASKPSVPSTTSTVPQQAYDYASLVDRWFNVYDKHHRPPPNDIPQSEFEVRRYISAWDGESGVGAEMMSIPISTSHIGGGALGLEELKRLAIEGMNTAPMTSSVMYSATTSSDDRSGEGRYYSMPIEGRVDLMRPKVEFSEDEDEHGQESITPTPARMGLPRTQQNRRSEHREYHSSSTTSGPTAHDGGHVSQDHDYPQQAAGEHSYHRTEESHYQGGEQQASGQQYRQTGLGQTGGQSSYRDVRDHDSHFQQGGQEQHHHNDDPAEVHYADHQSGQVGQGHHFPPHEYHHRNDNHHHHHEQHHDEQQHHGEQHHHHHQPPAVHHQEEPPRPPSPPMMLWNPAIEPPPNTTPNASAFPTNTYFENAWDKPQPQHHDHHHHQHQEHRGDHQALGESSPQHHSEPFFEPPPQPKIPEALLRQGHYRQVTGETEAPAPDPTKVKSIFPWEKDTESPRPAPSRVFPSFDAPPSSIQASASSSALPSEPLAPSASPSLSHVKASPSLSLSPLFGLPNTLTFTNAWDEIPSIQQYASKLAKPHKRPVAEIPREWRRPRSRGGRSDGGSRDGDVEDEGDETEDSDEGGLSEDPNNDEQETEDVIAWRKANADSRDGGKRKEYRVRGVQTIPPEMRSMGVQVNTIKVITPIPLQKTYGTISTSTEDKPMLMASEPRGAQTPPKSEKEGSPVLSGIRSPREFALSPEVSPTAAAKRPVISALRPVTPQQASIDTASSTSSIGPVSPPEGAPISMPSAQPKAGGPSSPSTPPTTVRKGGRVWDPARGVDIFKRSSEDVLARFLRMGSFEDREEPGSPRV